MTRLPGALAASVALALGLSCGSSEEALVGKRADGLTVVCSAEAEGVYGCDPEEPAKGGDPEPGACGSFAEGGAAIVLWPPNHELYAVDVAACARVRAGCGAARAQAPGGRVVAVTSDELLDVGSGGDGHTESDVDLALGAEDRVLLRAERQGGGDGRIYRIEIEGPGGERDACEVHVPHDRGPFGGAVDSGEALRLRAE